MAALLSGRRVANEGPSHNPEKRSLADLQPGRRRSWAEAGRRNRCPPMKVGGQMLRFIGTGLLNTAFGYAVYALLIASGITVWAAVGGAIVLGVVFNFHSYGKLVFGPSQPGRLPVFIAVYVILYVFNVGLLHLLMAVGMGAFLAQAILLPFMAALTFLFMRLFVFGRSSHQRRRSAHARPDTDHAGRRRL